MTKFTNKTMHETTRSDDSFTTEATQVGTNDSATKRQNRRERIALLTLGGLLGLFGHFLVEKEIAPNYDAVGANIHSNGGYADHGVAVHVARELQHELNHEQGAHSVSECCPAFNGIAYVHGVHIANQHAAHYELHEQDSV